MKKNGYTLIEILGVLVVLSVIAIMVIPVVNKMINKFKETNRRDQLETYVRQVNIAYMHAITKDSLYSFDSYEKGGITTNGVINFTNEWIETNITVNNGSVDCKNIVTTTDTDTLSKVFLDMNENKIKLTNCTVAGVPGYSYIDGKIVKK